MPDPFRHERLEAIHRLAERVGVVLVSVPALRAQLEALRYVPGLPLAALNELAAVLAIVEDMDKACRGSVPLFERLRRVV